MTENGLELRTKTRNLFASLDEYSRSALAEFIRDILKKDEEEAFKEIILIKLSPETFFEKSSFFWDTTIDEDIIQKVCGDITANYKKENPGCWLNTPLEEFPENLEKDMACDVTLLMLIKKRIIQRFEAPIDLERLEKLLNSDEENKRFGGLRELGFTKKESDRFKTYSDSIWEYILECFAPSYKKNFENIQNEETKTEIKKEDETSNMDEANKPLTDYMSEIVRYKYKIKELFDAASDAVKASSKLGKIWVEVENLGLDPERILEKKLTFLDLLNAMGEI